MGKGDLEGSNVGGSRSSVYSGESEGAGIKDGGHLSKSLGITGNSVSL